jgi:hypothetical protein
MTTERLQQLEAIEKTVTHLFLALQEVGSALVTLRGAITKNEAEIMVANHKESQEAELVSQTNPASVN